MSEIKPVEVFKIEAGVGKTHMAIMEGVMPALSEGKNVVFAVPEHNLSEEILDKIREAMISDGLDPNDAQVWKGITAEGQCERKADAQKVSKAGLSVASNLCFKPWTITVDGVFEPEKRNIGRTLSCPLGEGTDCCAMMQQRGQRPRLWITTHSSLMSEREAKFEGLGDVNLLIVDESPLKAALPSRNAANSISLGDLPSLPMTVNEKLEPVESAPDGVLKIWQSIARYVGDTPCQDWRQFSDVFAVFVGDVGDAIAWHEYQLKMFRLPSGLAGAELGHAIEARKGGAVHKVRLQVLAEIKRLQRDGAITKGLIVERWKDNNGLDQCALRFSEARSIDASWCSEKTDIKLLDATAPVDLSILKPIFKRPLEYKINGSAVWPSPDIVNVTQILSAPYTASKRDSERNRKHMRSVLRHVCERHSGDVLAVLQANSSLYDDDHPKPNNLDITSTGRARGSNAWEDCEAVVVMVQADAGPAMVEWQAAMLGLLDYRLPLQEDGGRAWWTRNHRNLKCRDGHSFTVKKPDHPSASVSALRSQMVQATLYQAIARSRFVNRTADTPLSIYVCVDELLEIEVDNVIPWDRVARQAMVSEMLADTGYFTNASHHAKAVHLAVDAVEDERRRTCDTLRGNVINNTYKESTEGVTSSRFVYQTAGGNHRNTLIYAHNAPFADDVKGYIESVVGETVHMLTDAGSAMGDAGLMYTSASHLMTAYPSAYNSPDACRQHLHRKPISCPNGWRAMDLLIDGRGQRTSTIFVHPSIAADEATELIEQQIGKKIRELKPKSAD